MEDLLERIITIADAFGRAEIPYSFGGAIAFGRDKDTRDISQMLDSMGERLDVSYVLQWVEAIVGSDTNQAQELTHALARRSLIPTS